MKSSHAKSLSAIALTCIFGAIVGCASDAAPEKPSEGSSGAIAQDRVTDQIIVQEKVTISGDADDAAPMELAEAEEEVAAKDAPAPAVAVAEAPARERRLFNRRGKKKEAKVAMKRPVATKPMPKKEYDSSVSVTPPMPEPDVVDPSESGPNEGYTDHGVNPMTETAKDRFSTFSIDVDTGSYTIARRKLTSGIKPPAASVRVEEFVNYFSYNYPEPDAGAFGVNLEAAPSPFSAEKDRFIVRVGVQGRHIPASKRKPVHLTFLVDVSGSMNRPDKLGLAKESLKVLTNNLKPGDTVALATYAGSTGVKLEPTSVEEKGRILSAIDGLTSGGGTAMNSGMEAAYKLAMNSHKTGHVNRVIVLSDGDANIGPSSHEEILKSIRSYVDEGVTMSTIGFGMGNYKDSLMEQLANKGNGNYYYIDTIKEARKVFGEQLDGTLEVIAKDVKLQVEFNPEAVSKYRLIGYENRDIADKDFRNDKVDAGEIGAGHSVTALYEVVMDPNFDGSLAYVRIRAKKPDGYKADEQIFMLTPSDVATKLADASKDFQFATAVAGFAEILRGSPYAKDLSFDLVSEVASAAASSNQKDRQEFIALVRKAKMLGR